MRSKRATFPEREARFTAMFDALAALLPASFVALDLACGPESISPRLLARFPGARAIAVDIDPVMLAIGQGAIGTIDSRLCWIQADPASPTLARLSLRVRVEQWTDTAFAARGIETAEQWWDALAAEPALAPLFTERTRRFARQAAPGHSTRLRRPRGGAARRRLPRGGHDLAGRNTQCPPATSAGTTPGPG